MNVLFFKVNGQNYFADANNVRYIIENSNLNITNIPNNQDASSLGWYMHQDRVYVMKDAGMMFQNYSIKAPKSVILFNNLIGLIVDNIENVVEIDESNFNTSPIVNKYINTVLIHHHEINLGVDVDKLRNYNIDKYIKKEQ